MMIERATYPWEYQ